MENEKLQKALNYARRGWRVFPIHPDGKAPVGKLVSNGVKDATTNEQKIRDWWNVVPSANIGFATGRTFAIDLDVGEDKDGRETWKQVVDEHEAGVPETLTVRTPSGGLHLYFKAPEGVTIKNSVSDAVGEGVDVRGHGGYVIVPPSEIDGDAYEWETAAKIADAPFWLVDVVRKDGRNVRDERPSVEEAPTDIGKGERNDKLTSLAGYLRHKGLTSDELFQALQAINEARCNPPLPEDEVRKIADSVARYEPKDATIRTATDEVSEPTPETREIARRLVATLYENPTHGPVIVPTIEDSEALPDIYGAVYGEMKEQGLVEGKIDRARLDTKFGGVEGYDRIKDPNGFDPSRHDDDPTQLTDWAETITSQHVNRRMARDLRALSSEIAESDAAPGHNVSRVIERVKDNATVGRTRLITFEEASEKARARLNDWRAGEASEYLRTWPALDDKIDGFALGQMTVMAGFTSGFKTASLVDLMKRVALRGDERVIPIFSAEMSAGKLFRRAASNLSGIPQTRLRPDRDGTIRASEAEFDKYEEAIDRLSTLRVYVDEHPNPSHERMLSFCLQLQAQAPIAFIGFDYLEKMDEDAATEELRVSKIAQNLKALAKRAGPPVVVLSQYSRQQHGGQYKPRNYYLRYSGKIEQEAETIVHWFWPRYFVERGEDPEDVWNYDPRNPNRIYAVVGKQREGEIATARMTIRPETGRFIDPIDTQEYEEGEDIFDPKDDDEIPF